MVVDNDIYGVVYLKDTVKPGIHQRFDEFRRMGIRTVMVTGDNPFDRGHDRQGSWRRRLPRPGQARGQDPADPQTSKRRASWLP